MATQTKPSRRRAQVRSPRLAAYARVSRQGERADDQFRSPELQLAAVRRMADARGFELVEYPAEIDVSGADASRAVLDEILDAIDAGELDGFAVAKLDRLSRLGLRDRGELLERAGRIESASEPTDDTPAGRMMRDQFFGYARMQWEQLAEGWEVSKAAAIADGKAIKAKAPFGYRFDEERRLIVDEREAVIVRELFQLRADGGSWDEISVRFEELTGERRSRGGFPHMLANRVYLGELRYGELVNYEAVDAIVPAELFDAVQARKGARKGRRPKSLLAGIAKCANCGGGLGRTPAGGAHYYRCLKRARECGARASINADALDAYVTGYVLDWLGADADEEHAVEVELQADGEQARARLERRLADALETLARYEENVELELENPAAYARGRKARVELVAKIERELGELGDASEYEAAKVVLRATLRDELTGNGDVDERRRLLGIVLERVSVRRGERRNAPLAERVQIVLRDEPGREG